MGNLSPHFSRAEFRCKGHGQPGHHDHPTPVDGHLVNGLEKIRAAAGGRPLEVISGHRCPWWNARQGGASRSQHLLGKAADIPQGFVKPVDAHEMGFGGVGEKNGWAVHVDTRPTRKVLWHY